MTLEEIEARWNAATPGPWELVGFDVPPSDDMYGIRGPDSVWVAYWNVYETDSSGCEEPEAIAAAPTDIAWLIARVRALEEELSERGCCKHGPGHCSEGSDWGW